MDGKGGRFSAECLEIERSSGKIRILQIEKAMENSPKVRMGVALGKANKWEELIRPLTELGVDRLTPLITERTEGSFLPSKIGDKKDRWKKIAREACKQSGNPWLPIFDHPLSLEEAFSFVPKDEDCWMGSLSAHSTQLSPSADCKKLFILIGPEGGWSPQEEANARISGYSFFSLGAYALRMETAAVSALAVARQKMLC